MAKLIFSSKIAKMLPSGMDAITIVGTVYFRNSREETPAPLVRHELVHIEQIKKEGALKFYFNYLFQYLKNRIHGMKHKDAYLNIPYEVEAYRKQMNRETI